MSKFRLLTSRDRLTCPHGGTVTPSVDQKRHRLHSGDEPILLANELLNGAIQCPDQKSPCLGVIAIVPACPIPVTIAGGQPIPDGSLILTNLGPVQIASSPMTSGVCLDLPFGPLVRNPKNKAKPFPTQPASPRRLSPGIYLGARNMDFPILKQLGQGRHQFLVLVPTTPHQRSDAASPTNIGAGVQGTVLSTEKRNDRLQLNVGESSDATFLRDYLENGSDEFDIDLRPLAVPAPYVLDKFIDRLIEGALRYEANERMINVRYPFWGGLVHGQSCLNSNSWTRGLLEWAQEQALPGATTDMSGRDICQANAIPHWYFCPLRFESSENRRFRLRDFARAQFKSGRACEVLEQISAFAVKRIEEDCTLLNPTAVLLEDLQAVLVGAVPDLADQRFAEPDDTRQNHFRLNSRDCPPEKQTCQLEKVPKETVRPPGADPVRAILSILRMRLDSRPPGSRYYAGELPPRRRLFKSKDDGRTIKEAVVGLIAAYYLEEASLMATKELLDFQNPDRRVYLRMLPIGRDLRAGSLALRDLPARIRNALCD